MKYQNRLFGKIGTYKINKINQLEIDDNVDLKICDFIFRNKLN